MAVNHVQALDSYPVDGWRSSRTHPLAKRETLTGPQVRSCTIRSMADIRIYWQVDAGHHHVWHTLAACQ